MRNLHVRVDTDVLARYDRLVFELRAAGYRTSASDVVRALLHHGPTDAQSLKRLIRAWQRTHDQDD